MSQSVQKPEEAGELEPEQAELLEVLEVAERPFLSLSDFEHRLQLDVSRNTLRKRLRGLEAKNLIHEKPVNPEKEKPVNYYYMNSPHSDWPMPPDVEPVGNDMTVEEFFNKDPVSYGIKGVGAGFLGAGLTYIFATFGAFFGTEGITRTVFNGGVIFGFLLTIAAYIMVAQALLQLFRNGDADILPFW